MTAFEFVANVRRSGGIIEVVAGKLKVRAYPGEVEIVALNGAAIGEALQYPDKWPCRKFASHPTTPTMPCRLCGANWAAHPRDLRQPLGDTTTPVVDGTRSVAS